MRREATEEGNSSVRSSEPDRGRTATTSKPPPTHGSTVLTTPDLTVPTPDKLPPVAVEGRYYNHTPTLATDAAQLHTLHRTPDDPRGTPADVLACCHNVPMLISAQYLDQESLLNYVASVENGLRKSEISHSKGSRGLGGSLGAGPLKAAANRDSESEETLTLEDHDSARLMRLVAAGHENPEKLGWVEVMDPDSEFAEIGLGAMVEWECDVYIPESVAVLSKTSGLRTALRQVQALAPAAQALGLDMEGLPASNEIQAVGDLLDNFDIPPVVVGDDSDTEWKVVGSLDPRWVRQGATLDDRVRIIGKVKKQVAAGRWYPLMSLPGMNLVNRDERRRMERQGPTDPAEEANYIKGPLLVVEFLAIYS